MPDPFGPLQIRDPPATGKYEAVCHFDNCGWSYFKWTPEIARDALVEHLETAHINPPPYPSENKTTVI